MPTARVDDRRHVAKLDRSVDRRFEVRLLVELSRATNVESPHRQLSARLTDRLGGNDPDRLADIHRRAPSEVTSIALTANALLRCADQRGADLHALEPDRLDLGNHRLVEQLTLGDDDLARLRIDNVFGGSSAEHAVGERCDGRSALDDRSHLERSVGAAILFDDDGILADVDKAAGQVARVRRLERRISKALAGAVRRIEILKDGQALLEVRNDRRFDDFARRLGHEAAHAGELLNLGLRAAGSECAIM